MPYCHLDVLRVVKQIYKVCNFYASKNFFTLLFSDVYVRPPPSTVKLGNSRDIPCCKGCALQIWSVGQAAKLPPFHGGVRGSIPLPTMVGSWLSLRLCGRSNYRTAISVRNLAGAHAVHT